MFMTHGSEGTGLRGLEEIEAYNSLCCSLKAEEFTAGKIETVIFHVGHLFLSDITSVQSMLLSFANSQVRLYPCY